MNWATTDFLFLYLKFAQLIERLQKIPIPVSWDGDFPSGLSLPNLLFQIIQLLF
jgi:hypothetical protein